MFTWKLNTVFTLVNLKHYNGGKGTYPQVVVRHLDAASLSGLQAVQVGHSHQCSEDFAVHLMACSFAQHKACSVAQHAAEDAQVVENQAVANNGPGMLAAVFGVCGCNTW